MLAPPCCVCWQAAKVNTPGQALLYFGCRKPDEDYLYEQDWQAFTDAGVLTKLRVAFSRAQQHKVRMSGHLLVASLLPITASCIV